MSLTSDDLDEYVEKIGNFFSRQNGTRNREEELILLIENLLKDLELCEENESALQKSLEALLQSEQTDINKKYFSLEEKCKELESCNENLKTQLGDLDLTRTSDLELQRQEFVNKLEELQQNADREIKNLKDKMESDRIYFETKEKKLSSQLQLAQASTAIQCDEIETSLKRQLADATSKIRQSQNLVRNLQLENNTLKSQVYSRQVSHDPSRNTGLFFKETPIQKARSDAINNVISYRPPADEEATPSQCFEQARPESNVSNYSSVTKILGNRESVQDEHHRSSEDFRSGDERFEGNYCTQDLDRSRARFSNMPIMAHNFEDKSPDVIRQKYQPVDVNQAKLTERRNDVVPIKQYKENKELYMPNLWKSKAPPLMPCTDSNTAKKNMQRKRKLYNPDDFEL